MDPKLQEAIDQALKAPAPIARDGFYGSGDAIGDLEASVIPHRDIVWLDRTSDGRQIVTHTLTMEQLPMRQGTTWELIFDEDGFGAVVPEDDAEFEVVVLEEALQYAALRANDDSVIVSGNNGQAAGSHVHLPTFQCKFSEVSYFLKIGATKHEHEFLCVVLKWPRWPAARLLFSLKAVYSALGFDQFGGEWWRWVAGSFPRWRAMLKEFGLDGHLVRSAQMEAVVGDSAVAMLEFPSASVWALLCLVLRWCYHIPRLGGMVKSSHKTGSNEFIMGLLGLLSPKAGESIELKVQLLAEWSVLWPRPQEEHPFVLLSLRADGTCDWRGFARQVSQRSALLKRGWWNDRKLIMLFDGFAGDPSLCEVLRATLLQKKLTVLHHQLLWQVGLRLQDLLLQVCHKGLKLDQVRCKQHTFEESLEHANSMVCRAFDGHLFSVADEKGEAAATTAKQLQWDRHRRFLKRSREDKDNSWRPNKKFRSSSKTWCVNLDNQIRQVLGINGLAGFVRPRSPIGQWRNWRSWRHLLVSLDQGSDGMCATNWLKHIGCNITTNYDFSHGCNNDYLDTIRDLRLFPWWVLMLVLFNMEHGPWSDDMRWSQVEEAWEECATCLTPSTCALFEAYSPQIVGELVSSGQLQLEPGEDPASAAWTFIKGNPLQHKKGYRTQMSRFMAARRVGRGFLDKWWWKRFQYEYCAIESGMLSESTVQKLNIKHAAQAGDTSTTDPARLCPTDKALRSACQNSLVISCFLLSERINLSLMKVVVHCTEALSAWHSDQNKKLRSATAAKTWYVEQLSGGFDKHIKEGLAVVQDPDILRDIGFVLPGHYLPDDESRNEATAREQELADLFGSFAVCLAGRRYTRTLWLLRGWPSRMAAIMGTREMAMDTMREFQADLEAFEAMCAVEGRSKFLKRLGERSCFNQVSVQQWVEAAREVGFTDNMELRSMAFSKTCGMVASQAAEDSFNYMKNNRRVKGKRKFRRPEKCMSSVLSRGVLDRLHHYKTIDVTCRPKALSVCVPKVVWQAPLASGSLPFGAIVGVESTPKWYSPGAGNASCFAADLELARWAKRTGRWSDLDRAWLSGIVKAKHQLLLRQNGSDDWYFAVHSWQDSAVLAIRAKGGMLPNTDIAFWEVDMNNLGPCLLVLVSLDEWQAVCYTWRSPLWQSDRCGGDQGLGLAPALRATSSNDRGPEPLLTVCARMAFWNIDKTFLVRLGTSILGLPIGSSDNLLDVLVKVIGRVLPALDPEGVLGACKHRVALLAQTAQWSEEILELDEAMEVLERHDINQAKQQKTAASAAHSEAKSFKADFSSRMQRISAASTVSKSKKSSSRGGGRTKYPMRVPHFPAQSIDLGEARKLVPEGGSLWRDQKFGSWQAHFPPYPRVGRSWRKYGEAEALRLVLENLWDWYLLDRGLQRPDCPIQGIFREPTSQTASASSSSR